MVFLFYLFYLFIFLSLDIDSEVGFLDYIVNLNKKACMLSHVQLLGTLWTVPWQASLSMELSRREYWSGLPFPTLEGLPDPEIKPTSLVSPALAGGFFSTSITWYFIVVSIN